MSQEPRDTDQAPEPPTTLNLLLDRKAELGQLVLIALLGLEILAIGVMATWTTVSSDLWTITGLTAMLLLILSNRQGAGVFVVILAISTMVAREEFLLEIAAIYQGESLQGVRESRVFGNIELSAGENQDEQKLKARMVELFESGKDPGTIFDELETYEQNLDIERDLGRLTDAERWVIKLLAAKGTVNHDTFVAEVEAADMGVEREEDALAELVGSEYIRLKPGTQQIALTEKGRAMARRLGLNPKSDG